ncbi:hypothetical protein BDV18DRAFT_49605 [Aspergillus unguis]
MDALPTCALTCLAKAAKAAQCMPTDPSCICENPKLNQLLEPCILTSCSVKEAFTAKRMSDKSCGVAPPGPADTLVDVSTVFLVIAIICTMIRVAARILGRNFGLDDLFIILGLGVGIGIGGIAFPIRDLGLGKDIWDIPFDDITHILYLFSILTTIYPVAIACIKLSMLFLYLRLFPNPKLRIISWITIGFVAAWGIIYVFVNIFVCTPRSFQWESWDGEHQGTCMSKNAIVVSHAIENIIFDVFIIALPLPVLWNLQLSIPKKIGVSLMFLVGLVVTVLSILRLVFTFGFLKSSNPTRDFVPVSIWSVLEIDIGIICACFPGMRAFFKFVFPSAETTGRSYDFSDQTSGTRKTARFSNLSISSTGRVRPSKRENIPLQETCSSRQGLVSPINEESVPDYDKMRTAMYDSD